VNYVNQLDKNILISDETKKLLDTGGGIKKAFSLINTKNILVMNSDVLWNSHSVKSIQSLLDQFNSSKMDSLLLTTKIENTTGYAGAGDFIKNKDNQLQRFSKNTSNKALVYCGIQIVNRRQFDNYRDKVFSTNKIWDQNIKQNKLYTFVTNKKFNHVGTKESVIKLNK
jgi:MurNAc alpha-1-phosphate uridylyltransferase